MTSRYWHRYIGSDGKWKPDPVTGLSHPPGEDLAALRTGLSTGPAEAHRMWRHYRTPLDDEKAVRGLVSAELQAEHAALALYGLHQQGRKDPMHHPKIGVGLALRRLRHHGKFSESAVDTRVAAAVNTTSVSALLMRLRGLVTQLRDIGQPMDYDRLLRDIERWQWPESRRRVRRDWGLGYYAWEPKPDAANKSA